MQRIIAALLVSPVVLAATAASHIRAADTNDCGLCETSEDPTCTWDIEHLFLGTIQADWAHYGFHVNADCGRCQEHESCCDVVDCDGLASALDNLDQLLESASNDDALKEWVEQHRPVLAFNPSTSELAVTDCAGRLVNSRTLAADDVARLHLTD